MRLVRPTVGNRQIALTAALAAGFLLAACSTAASTAGSGTAASTPPAPAITDVTSAAATPAFPATVDSVYGELTSDAAPQRIVALTYQVADIRVSLGVHPVAV